MVIIVADLWVDSIVEIGTLSEGALIGLLRRVERWMLRRADVVTAVTEGVRDALIDKGVASDRLAWLPNGADTTMFAPGDADPELRDRLTPSDEDHLFLYAGTHGYVHGFDVVLDAAQLLADVPVRIVLVGDGSEKAGLQERARQFGIDNVVFLDPVAPEEVAAMLRCATAALASVRAGDVYRTIRSAKAIPAMASAVPVLYSGDDEGSRLVAAVGAGRSTAPGDPRALADAIRTSWPATPSCVRRSWAAGREWVLEHASWHHLVGRGWCNWTARPESRGRPRRRAVPDR